MKEKFIIALLKFLPDLSNRRIYYTIHVRMSEEQRNDEKDIKQILVTKSTRPEYSGSNCYLRSLTVKEHEKKVRGSTSSPA